MSEPSGASFAVSINQKSSGHSFISSTESSSSVRDLTASNELSHLKQKLKDTESINKELVASCEMTREQLGTRKEEMKHQQARIEQLETELIQVKLELEQLQDKHDKVVLAKTKSLDKQQAAMVQNTALQDEIAELRGQLQIKNAQVEDLNQLASTRREEKKQLQGRLLAMQQIRADLIEQNEAKQVNIDQLVGRLTVQGEENKELVKEVEQLKQELACTQENIAELVRAGPTIHQPTAAPASPDNEPTQPPTQDSIVDRAAYDALHQAYESLELNYHSAKDSVKELATKLQCTEIKVDVLSVHLKQAKEEYEFLANEIMSSRNVSLVALPSLQLISMIKLYNP